MLKLDDKYLPFSDNFMLLIMHTIHNQLNGKLGFNEGRAKACEETTYNITSIWIQQTVGKIVL